MSVMFGTSPPVPGPVVWGSLPVCIMSMSFQPNGLPLNFAGISADAVSMITFVPVGAPQVPV